MCIRIKNDEIFGLLGPNGAGKTTTIEMLCGLQNKTAGEIIVSGKKVDRLSDVTQTIGVCTQFDILWDDLTIREHLSFYSRIKGVPENKINAITSSTAEALDLDGDEFWLCPTQLSGGNKRRLSLAISILGHPKIVLLDEPTTGLDPETRRYIWNVIKDIRDNGMTVLLTTHSMEEADALCTKIGIMAKGNLQCIGNQQHLKNKYGSGYRLKVLSPNCKWNIIDEIIKNQIFENAVVVRTSGKTRTYKLDVSNEEISDIFEKLHNCKNEEIREWSINQSSLEEVFIRICQEETDLSL